MGLTFTLLTIEDARAILAWRYEGEYAIYNADAASDDALEELLERRSPYYAVRDDENELVGFFCFGTAAQPWSNETPRLYSEGRLIDIGLGMRPDTTGQGAGLAFMQAGLAFAREQFAPAAFRLFVLAFNKRAMRVYEKAGFKQSGVLTRQSADGIRTFLEMRREA